eukprot:TRINITY_DN4049_c0_g1_i1.p1 TRINITY_DN4049_c0_g1~~TRINITY_DN4049_c0_g1_i1.p1  ORF type:complete len:71 (-),score=17.06 TRINITY_DN4049_c0_g1_i1:70-282(-)
MYFDTKLNQCQVVGGGGGTGDRIGRGEKFCGILFIEETCTAGLSSHAEEHSKKLHKCIKILSISFPVNEE